MKLKTLIYTALLSAVVTTTAQADTGGLFVEPAVTYETGTLKLTYPPPSNSSDENIKGFGLGVRLGFHVYDVIFLAFDARYSKPNYDSSALGTSADSSAYNAGLTLGLQTPVAGLRVWGTYIADGMIDPNEINNVNMKYSNFTGYRVGAGIYVAVVSINLEYQEAKYGKTTVENVGPFAGGTLDDVNGTQKSWIVSLSFPIAL